MKGIAFAALVAAAVSLVMMAAAQLDAASVGECPEPPAAARGLTTEPTVERLNIDPSDASRSWDMSFGHGRSFRTANLSFDAPDGKSFDPDLPVTARISGDLLDRETNDRLLADR